jgi:hypothetical protein
MSPSEFLSSLADHLDAGTLPAPNMSQLALLCRDYSCIAAFHEIPPLPVIVYMNKPRKHKTAASRVEWPTCDEQRTES